MANILVVDDSVFSRNKTCGILRQDGHKIVEAVSGLDAFRKLASAPADCIVLDLLMPELDGFGVLERLRLENNKIPVIVMTADVQESVRNRCKGLGAAAFLNKPTRSEELRATITGVLQDAGADRFTGADLSPYQIDVLTELINIGVGHSAAVLNEMLSTHVTLSVPKIQVLRWDKMIEYMKGVPNQDYSSVRLAFNGAFQGNASLVFNSEDAYRLVLLLTGSTGESVASESVLSATLTEVGNIVINGIVGHIANELNVNFSYSIPEYRKEKLSEIFSDGMSGCIFLLADTQFQVQERKVAGEMILFFEVNSVSKLIASLKEEQSNV